MRLNSRITVLAVTHQPASTYLKDGQTRTKKESWEAMCRYPGTAYSRVKKEDVAVTVEELHESRVELKPGDYDCVIQPAVFFGELKLTITEAVPLNKPAK